MYKRELLKKGSCSCGWKGSNFASPYCIRCGKKLLQTENTTQQNPYENTTDSDVSLCKCPDCESKVFAVVGKMCPVCGYNKLNSWVEKTKKCSKCGGTGYNDIHAEIHCHFCGGDGYVSET